MKTYLISYDLRVPETSEDYRRLIAYIKTYDYYAKPLLSLWFIKTSKTVTTVRDEIKSATDSNDRILVIDVTGANWATDGVTKENTAWMKSNI